MRVLVADDHSIVRSGLKYLLRELAPQVDVLEATTFDQAWGLIDNGGTWDLLIMDLRMPGYSGLDKLKDLVGTMAPVPVVAFSMFESPDEMRAVLATGVRAFIPKSTSNSLIVNILRLVLAGGIYVPPVLGGIGEGGGEAPAALIPALSATSMPALTRRQQEVLSLMAEGLANQEISDRMGLNLSTVKTHVTGIFKALGVENRTQAVLVLKQAWCGG